MRSHLACQQRPLISNPPPPQQSCADVLPVACQHTWSRTTDLRAAFPKSLPLDYMPTPLLKATVDVMAPFLTQLANLSFTAGVSSTRYKLGHVTPLLKKPSLSKDDPANYKPITNLRTFSKILEWLALKRQQLHVLESGSYSRFQSAYRPSYSTESALR